MLRERLARRGAGEHAARLRGPRRRLGRRVRERRPVARRELPVVDVGAHRLHAVRERAEHGEPAIEEAEVERVVGPGRRAPDDEDRLVGGLRHLDEVAGERLAEHLHRAGDRDDEQVDVRIGDDQIEDAPAAGVGDGRAAAVDGVRDAQVLGDQPVVQGALRLLRERRDPQPGGRDHVGHVRARAARDRVDADAVAGCGSRPCERGRGVEEVVEPVGTGDPELTEHGRGHRVGSGEVAGVRHRHRLAFVGAPDLHDHHRLLQLGGVVGGEHEGAPVLEPFDVRGDHADVGLVGEVAREVGELEVDLVAGRRPMGEPDADLLALEHGPALVAALGDERDRRAR